MSTIESIIKRLGSTYMPPNAVHFSDLAPDVQQQMLARAPILRERHFDWWVMKVQRTYTTWWVPFPPPKARGNAQEIPWPTLDEEIHLYCKPIPVNGEWFETAGRTEDIVGYRASTDELGNINRSGARFDDVDDYMTWPSFRAGSFTDFLSQLF